MITLAALGDICPGDHYFTLGHGLGSRLSSGVQPLAPLLTLLRGADLVLANLEGPLAESSEREGAVESRVFRGPPVAARRFREAGITVVNIANNHILQHGGDAFRETCANLEKAQVTPLGRRGDGFACSPVVRQVGPLALGLLGYSLVPERYARDQTEYASPSVSDMISDIQALSDHVDAVVVSVHWGDEAVEIPSPEVIVTARALVDAGARVVLGHHAHVFQPVVRYGRGIIAFGLGNALFDLFFHRPMVEGALLRVRLGKQSDPDWDLVPLRFRSDYSLAPMAPRGADAFRERLARATDLLTTLSPNQYSKFYGRHLRECEHMVQMKKLPFFLWNLARGDAGHKVGFVCRKLTARFSFS